VHGDTPLRQLGCDQISSLHFSKTQLRVGVNLFAYRGNASGLGGDGINDFHNKNFALTVQKILKIRRN
jgi:hypothetical protein